jgi:hypothetical protein
MKRRDFITLLGGRGRRVLLFVAARGARATAGDAGHWLPQSDIA